jgi:sarcosine oxidase subunit beta
MNSIRNHEVVVVGGGIMGCATAYFLARDGRDVALVERAVQVGTEASGRNAGGIRQNGRPPAELPLAMASVKLWQFFRDELGGPFEYEQNGNMALAFTEEEVQALEQGASRLQGQGLDVRHVRGADIRDLCPNVSNAVLAANYCPTDGFANPILATRFVARCARQLGATIYLETQVVGITMQGGGITSVQTNQGTIATGAVVNTAGPWANEIAAMVGRRLPIVPRPTQLSVTLPMPPVLRQFISGKMVYIRPTRAGNLLIGGGGPKDPPGFTRENTYSRIHRFLVNGIQILPALKHTSMLRAWAGILAISPDFYIIIDRMPGIENMVFATGCSGTGFCTGLGAGKVLAEMIQGRAPTIPIEGLRLSRFPPDLDFASVYQSQPEP